jgi:hypothetical protein
VAGNVGQITLVNIFASAQPGPVHAAMGDAYRTANSPRLTPSGSHRSSACFLFRSVGQRVEFGGQGCLMGVGHLT